MHSAVIADTSCFIMLDNIGRLEVLQKVYGQIITTPEVASEYGAELPPWVRIRESADKQRQYILELQIDKGESSAIALALEVSECLLIVDDYKARKIAQQLGLNITGTVGVIVKAKLTGIIPSVKPLIERIRQSGFRMSSELEMEALKLAGEI